MFDKIEAPKELSKEEYKELMKGYRARLLELQMQCKELEIPVIILFEGMDAAGKGLQIGKLIQGMDPRGFQVYTTIEPTKEELRRPALFRFWKKTPAKGRVAVFNCGWYNYASLEEIRSFEKQLTDGGTSIIKLFLYINKEEQEKRFKKLEEEKATAWRVTKEDWKKNKKFEAHEKQANHMVEQSDYDFAPWNVIVAQDKRATTAQIYSVVLSYLENKIKSVNREKAVKTFDYKEEKEVPVPEILQQVDLNQSISEDVYRVELKELQKKIERLHGELYQKGIPVVIGFEGWDAAGKGGAIKRLTEKMDARGYVVHPVAAPNDIERVHHYLWRFWIHAPKTGHVAVFDRTWYGRVMVERVEGFCTTKEWKRAYQEINEMEASFVSAGAIVLKFWMQIDKEEQKNRFETRMNTPEKQYKITDEDWRNREKWDQYEVAVNEMIEKTSTPDAPWIIVEGNDKYYARIKVLRTVVEAMEKRLGK